jgi:pyridinium-3,5-biscarboxylic acid mononucleotide synthase
MDAALVSVVRGLVSSAVIALPTSIGYGAACAALRILRVTATSQKSAQRVE